MAVPRTTYAQLTPASPNPEGQVAPVNKKNIIEVGGSFSISKLGLPQLNEILKPPHPSQKKIENETIQWALNKAAELGGKFQSGKKPPVPKGLVDELQKALFEPGMTIDALEALSWLGFYGGPAVPRIRVLFKDNSQPVSVRLAAAEALSKIGPTAKTAIPDLTQAFQDPQEEIVLKAVYAVASFGHVGASAAPALKNLYDHTQTSNLKRAALYALFCVDEENLSYGAQLRDALTSSEVSLNRTALALALQKTSELKMKIFLPIKNQSNEAVLDSYYISALPDLMESSDPETALLALQFVQKYNWDFSSREEPVSREVLLGAIASLIKIKPGKAKAVNLPVKISDKEKAARDELKVSLRDVHQYVDSIRFRARRLLKHLDPSVRAQALLSLEALAKEDRVREMPKVITAAGNMLKSGTPEERLAAFSVLENAGSGAHQYLTMVEAYEELYEVAKDDEMRRAAFFARVEMDPSQRETLLLNALLQEDDSMLADRALHRVRVKGGLGRESLKKLCEKYASGSEDLQLRVISVLEYTSSLYPESVNILVEVAKPTQKFSEKYSAIYGLEEFLKETKDQEGYSEFRMKAIKACILALQDSDIIIRENAAQALINAGQNKQELNLTIQALENHYDQDFEVNAQIESTLEFLRLLG